MRLQQQRDLALQPRRCDAGSSVEQKAQRVRTMQFARLTIFANRRIRTRTYGGVGGAVHPPLSRSVNGRDGNGAAGMTISRAGMTE